VLRILILLSGCRISLVCVALVGECGFDSLPRTVVMVAAFDWRIIVNVVEQRVLLSRIVARLDGVVVDHLPVVEDRVALVRERRARGKQLSVERRRVRRLYAANGGRFVV
jgi:hypothetical protein